MLFCVGCIILHHYTSQCVSVCVTTTKKKIVVTLRMYYDREHTDLGGRLTFIDFTYFFIFIVILLAAMEMRPKRKASTIWFWCMIGVGMVLDRQRPLRGN